MTRSGGATRDPRDVITQDAFRLAPELLGTPLARPWRRGAAMAVDGMAIAVLSAAPDVLLGFAAALVLFRVSGRPSTGSYLRASVRFVLRFVAAVILFVVVLTTADSVSDALERRNRDEETTEEGDAVPGISGVAGLRTGVDVARLTQAETEAEARERAERLIPTLRAAGMEEDDIREMLEGLAEAPGRPWVAAGVDSALARLARPAPPPAAGSPDSLLAVYAAASARGDRATMDSLRPLLVAPLAADTLAALQEELREEESSRRALQRRVEALQEEVEDGPGLVAILRGLADDLGVGIGWAGLYFTSFVALWGGRTPGKRLLGVRIIRLDGQPIGWWAAFERFGGYAAGFATGLLGFLQIVWDRNRQAVHDKIAETVVVRD